MIAADCAIALARAARVTETTGCLSIIVIVDDAPARDHHRYRALLMISHAPRLPRRGPAISIRFIRPVHAFNCTYAFRRTAYAH
jgi:hypothetical protein